jgi:transposase-like protein
VSYFRTKPWLEVYSFLWIDAVYEKVRLESRVTNLASMIAHAVNLDAKKRF